ncbi:MCP four helix bundle domain-containing protein [Massilia violaceinigra]|uniref:MCP four helix bundle domain-containing protein n=1 Tax=Massilia violaceinigra TaxID=2045208 RepID=A0ABY4AGE2_9BURK|nr:methyl-accepting chemotaxis protein [Massilia violaceinigra]UOD33502.1 MCP four helix bundle domain-containing protein [Massilia violaceinigra]
MFSHLKIGARLAIGFGLTICILLVMSLLGINRIRYTSSLTDHIVNDRYVQVELTNVMRSYANRGAQSLRNAMLAPDPAQSKALLGSMLDADRTGAEAASRLGAMMVADEAKQLFQDQSKAFDAYFVLRSEAVKRFGEGGREDAVAFLFKEVIPIQNAYFGRLDAVLKYQTALMARDGKEAADASSSATLLMLLLLALATAVSALAGWLITRSVTVPIGEAVALAETVARGDLTTRIVVTRQDETGRLLSALKDMVESLTRTVGAVRSGTDTITTASSEIAAGNMDLASRTENQATSLEETASSMEELTSIVKQNADNARQANTLVVSAAEHANKGGRVVSDVVGTMGAIRESSGKIVDIISVIDGIAFQTNILALNAAVEAARAGEQGRGFAVVASEVRNLAQRSASAAKEIKALIDDSVGKVETGSELVNQAGATMEQIMGSVRQVADIMGEIAAASAEQSAGINQVNGAIVAMDNATQQNAALVEQAAAAAASMQGQAVHLAEAVSVFKLHGDEMAGAALRTPARAKAVAAAAARPAVKPATRLAKPATKPAADADAWEEF